MAFNLMDEVGKLTSKVAGTVSEKAKDSALSTLKDPEFKATVSQFGKDFFNDNSYWLVPVILSFFLLTFMAIANIISNFKARR